MAMSASKVAEKWSRNLSQAGPSIVAGVQGVTESPTEKAAAAADRMVQGVQRAVADGKYQAGLRRVSLEDWKRATIDKGAARVASGAVAARPKMEQFMGEWLPYMEEGKRKLESMPRGSLEQNVQRMIAQVQHAAQFRRRS